MAERTSTVVVCVHCSCSLTLTRPGQLGTLTRTVLAVPTTVARVLNPGRRGSSSDQPIRHDTRTIPHQPPARCSDALHPTGHVLHIITPGTAQRRAFQLSSSPRTCPAVVDPALAEVHPTRSARSRLSRALPPPFISVAPSGRRRHVPPHQWLL